MHFPVIPALFRHFGPKKMDGVRTIYFRVSKRCLNKFSMTEWCKDNLLQGLTSHKQEISRQVVPAGSFSTIQDDGSFYSIHSGFIRGSFFRHSGSIYKNQL